MSDFSLEQLLDKLGPEEQVEIDWNAPEAGQFPPIATPGVYDFVFRLREDKPFDHVNIEGTEYLTVIFDADILVNGVDKTLTYQRVVNKQWGKGLPQTAQLARSLKAIPQNNPPGNRDWVETFSAASGRARGRAKLIWTFFDKETGVTYSTSPRNRKNKELGRKVMDQPWPRNADGTFQDTVTDSKGQKHYGRAEFTDYFSTTAEANGVGA